MFNEICIYTHTYIFNKSYKKLITKDKFLFSLINYHLMVPKIYKLPKTHKPGILLQPIISWKELLPHNTAKSITKMLNL